MAGIDQSSVTIFGSSLGLPFKILNLTKHRRPFYCIGPGWHLSGMGAGVNWRQPLAVQNLTKVGHNRASKDKQVEIDNLPLRTGARLFRLILHTKF